MDGYSVDGTTGGDTSFGTIQVEWMVILLMKHRVLTLHSLLLVRAMLLRHRAISDPSLTAVSRHLPTMSRQ